MPATPTNSTDLIPHYMCSILMLRSANIECSIVHIYEVSSHHSVEKYERDALGANHVTDLQCCTSCDSLCPTRTS
jgi:hypothetical protein